MYDDNPYNLIPLEEMLLEQYQLNSTVFDSGENAVQCFMKRLLLNCCAKKYKIVFTDIQMPGMDGFGVAKMINSA